jgi:two-component system, OmpR family, phosphate regulon sensor histidine kinase PhoR
VWNKIKLNFSSSRIFLLEFFLLDLISIVIASFFLKLTVEILLFGIFILLLSGIILFFIGKKRRAELAVIGSIIHNIRKDFYLTSDEIHLSKYLPELQEEIKKMFERIQSDITYLKRLERIRTEFLANVSHELRTPIFAIQGFIETLLDGAIDDKKVNKSFLEKANQHTINLSNLLNDLIDISMIESGEMRMSFRYFNVNEYLGLIVQEFKLMADEKGITLTYHPARDGLQFFGDKNKLKQVMINLLTNAIKYTEAGSVDILVEEEKNHGKIIIKDTGIGLSETDAERIFERFYRVDKARSRSVGGTGLGLAIVKHIVEAHGSKVEIKSKLNEGSEFSFSLKK